MMDFEVVIPAALTPRWDAMASPDQSLLSARLQRAAHSASARPVRWPDGAAGVHRGRHRAITGELWVLFQLNEPAHRLDVIGFGRVDRTPAPHW